MKLSKIEIGWDKPLCHEQVLNLVRRESLDFPRARKVAIERYGRSWSLQLYATTQCVTNLLQGIAGQIENELFCHLSFICVSEDAEERVCIKPHGRGSVFMQYDPWPLLHETDDLCRKRIAGEIIETGIGVLGRLEPRFDIEPLVSALDNARALDFDNVWLWKRAKSRSGKVAEILVFQDTMRYRVDLIVTTKKGLVLNRQTIAEGGPSTSYIRERHLGSMRWEDELLIVEAQSGFKYELLCG